MQSTSKLLANESILGDQVEKWEQQWASGLLYLPQSGEFRMFGNTQVDRHYYSVTEITTLCHDVDHKTIYLHLACYSFRPRSVLCPLFTDLSLSRPHSLIHSWNKCPEYSSFYLDVLLHPLTAHISTWNILSIFGLSLLISILGISGLILAGTLGDIKWLMHSSMHLASIKMSAIILYATVIVSNIIKNHSVVSTFCYLEICLSFPRAKYIRAFPHFVLLIWPQGCAA